MNRTLKIKGQIDMQQLKTCPNYHQESKNEIRSHKKNINRLIFYQSDEEHSSQNENMHEQLYRTAREITRPNTNNTNKRQVRETFKNETMMLRPSIMKFGLENESEYGDFMPNPQKKTPAKQNNYVSLLSTATNKDERTVTISKQPKKQEAQSIIFQEEIQLPSPPKIDKKESKLSQIVPSTLYFQDSEDEANKEGPTQEKQVMHAYSESIFNQNTTINQQQPTQRPVEEKIEPFNLLKIDSATVQRGSYFSNIVKDIKKYEAISSLMFLPLLDNTRQIFQVHVCNSILQKTFQFWLDCHPKMKLLMRAKKITKLHRTEYQITTYFQGCQQFCQTCTIVSNIERSEFNIEKSAEQKKQLLGTISCSVTLQSSKNLVLYFPVIDPQTRLPMPLFQDSEYTTLKQVYQLKETHSISYLLTTKLKIQEKLQLMRDFKFKVSDKSMQFRSKQGELRLVIGKKASKTYTVIVGPGLTPVQIFSLAIINIETN